MTLFLRAVLGVSLLGLVACDDGASSPPPEQPEVTIRGGLDRATFTYDCAAPSDPQCNVDADLAPIRKEKSPFPQIALGSRFKLSTVSIDYPVLRVAPVSTDFLEPQGEGVVLAKRRGASGVLAQQLDGTAIDFANLEIVAPAKYEILQATPQGDFRGANVNLGGGSVSAQASVVYTFKFRVVARGEDDNILAGALPCQWTSSNEQVAKIEGDATSNVVTVKSASAGNSDITVTFGDFTGVVRIEVK